jgi:pyruvate ferredoxin oxidoreductase alpha subunit
LRSFRPFPIDALKEAFAGLTDLVVLERAFSPGLGGIVGSEVRQVLAEMENPPRLFNFAVGLGGRDVPLDTYPRLIETVRTTSPGRFSLFDVMLEKLPEEDR